MSHAGSGRCLHADDFDRRRTHVRHEPRIPKAEITGLYGYLLKRFSVKMLGEVPDGAAVMWQNRPVLMSLTSFGRKVQKWTRSTPT